MIHIYYSDTIHRAPPRAPREGRPDWFDYEKGFKNLLDTMDHDVCKLTVLFDGDDSGHYVHKYKSDYNFRLINITEQKNKKLDSNKGKEGFDGWAHGWACWHVLIEIVREEILSGYISDSDIIYRVENDYVHAPGWCDKVLALFSVMSGHYVSLYDCGDKYWTSVYPNLNAQLFLNNFSVDTSTYKKGSHHWRTTPSTTGTYLIKPKILLEDYDMHSTYFHDHDKHLRLKKERGRLVVSPIPGLACHCQLPWLSPCVDWESIINK